MINKPRFLLPHQRLFPASRNDPKMIHEYINTLFPPHPHRKLKENITAAAAVSNSSSVCLLVGILITNGIKRKKGKKKLESIAISRLGHRRVNRDRFYGDWIRGFVPRPHHISFWFVRFFSLRLIIDRNFFQFLRFGSRKYELLLPLVCYQNWPCSLSLSLFPSSPILLHKERVTQICLPIFIHNRDPWWWHGSTISRVRV